MTLPQLLKFGADRGIFPKGYHEQLSRLRNMRNQVAHPRTGEELSDGQVSNLVSQGAQLLEILAG